MTKVIYRNRIQQTERDRMFLLSSFIGKAFSFVALIQNLDVVIGTVACVKIYQATISIFSGAVFIFAVGTRFLALLLIL